MYGPMCMLTDAMSHLNRSVVLTLIGYGSDDTIMINAKIPGIKPVYGVSLKVDKNDQYRQIRETSFKICIFFDKYEKTT